MKLRLITEAADLKSMMDRYDQRGYTNFELVVKHFAPKNAAKIFAETARAVVDYDLRKEQRYWDLLQKRLLEERSAQPPLTGQLFKAALTKAFGIQPSQKAKPGNSQPTQGGAATQGAAATQNQGITLGGLLKGAARLYVGAYAREHGLSMPGENKIPNNVKILSTFAKELGTEYKITGIR